MPVISPYQFKQKIIEKLALPTFGDVTFCPNSDAKCILFGSISAERRKLLGGPTGA